MGWRALGVCFASERFFLPITTLLTMSYITIPKRIKKIKSNNKPLDVYVWATIRRYSDYKDGTSHITIDRLEKIIQVNEKTIRRSIHRLEEAGLLRTSRNFIDAQTRRNTYDTSFRMLNFFMLDRAFFEREYSPKIAGFVLLLKSVCLNGTNYIEWNKHEIAQGIGMARNTVSALLDECLRHNLITHDKGRYTLTGEYFINDSLRSMDKEIFDVLEKFCKERGSTLRPYKSKSRVALEMIGACYRPLENYLENPQLDLRYNLEKSSPVKLPKMVSIEYFLKPLKLQIHYDKYLCEKQNRPKLRESYPM